MIERTLSVGFAIWVRDQLRTSLDAERGATDAEAPLTGETLTLPEIASASIVLGDHPSFAPSVYPAVRIDWPQQDVTPMVVRGLAESVLTLRIAVYLASDDLSGSPCVSAAVEAQTIRSWAYAEMVRAVVERVVPTSATYGARVFVTTLREVAAPQDPEKPCGLYKKYLIEVRAHLRVRQSLGLAAP